MLSVAYHVNSVYSSISYLLTEDSSKKCWMVDVGDYKEIKAMSTGFALKGVLLTHVHFDHIYGLNELLDDYPSVKIYTNEFGMKSLYDPMENLSCYHEKPFMLKPEAHVECLHDGDIIKTGGYQMKVFETPGHDPSCLCYEVDGLLFTGDSYIPGIKVFTKFQNSDKSVAEKYYELLKRKSYRMKVLAGHLV